MKHKIILKIFVVLQGMTLTPQDIQDGLARLDLPMVTEIRAYNAYELTLKNRLEFYYAQLTCSWKGVSCIYVLPGVEGFFGGHSLARKEFSDVYYVPGFERVGLMIIISEYLKGLGCKGTGDVPGITSDNAASLEYILPESCRKILSHKRKMK